MRSNCSIIICIWDILYKCIHLVGITILYKAILYIINLGWSKNEKNGVVNITHTYRVIAINHKHFKSATVYLSYNIEYKIITKKAI